MLNIHDSTDHSRNHSLDSSDSFEIVTKSNKKHQICRNFQQTGKCKFGEQCFFVHPHQNVNLNQLKQKNKPCRRYFSGICSYGPKCQFLHYECVDLPEHREFVERCFKEQKLMVPLHPNKMEPSLRFDVQRFRHLYKIFGRKLNFKRDDLVINLCRTRLKCFTQITQEPFERLLMSASRKESEQC